MPARDYLFGLDGSDQRKFATLFQRMATEGRIFDEVKFRREDDVNCRVVVQGRQTERKVVLYAFKIDGHRLIAFQDGRAWLLTDGCAKLADRKFKAQLDIAHHIACEHLGRFTLSFP